MTCDKSSQEDLSCRVTGSQKTSKKQNKETKKHLPVKPSYQGEMVTCNGNETFLKKTDRYTHASHFLNTGYHEAFNVRDTL